MQTSTAWINDYLDPPATAEEQGDILTRAGFPLEVSEQVSVSTGTDTRQDFEMTSNRGDCACHLGLAREIAAMSLRTLKLPAAAPKAKGPPAKDLIRVTNEEHERCPLYSARVIRGVKVGPSPDWLKDRLIARGDIPRNNLVDLTNFVLFEYGQPTHVFDLAKLRGPEIIVRLARPNEPFLPIGEGAVEIKLSADDLVIADGERAAAIAGVKGGALTAVSNNTTDILIEGATFSPVSVRNTSRRLNIASDSSYRYERGVHPAQIDPAVDRLVDLILELCGGELCEGVVSAGAELPLRRNVTMRCSRCRKLLGMDVTDEEMVAALTRLGFEPQHSGDTVNCVIPIHRLDIEREVDLIEEVSRVVGHDNIPIVESLQVRIAPPQSTVLAKRAVSDNLVGMGFLETVTHTLVSETAASHFLAGDANLLCVDERRAAAEPALRPSVLPSLLRVYAHNRDSGSPSVKLFEMASTFVQSSDSTMEQVQLALLQPAEQVERALREMRGAIDRLVQIVLGDKQVVHVQPTDDVPWFMSAGSLNVGEQALGHFGVMAPEIAAAFDLSEPIMAAELKLPQFYDRYPPETEARALPTFPAIERDISAVLDEHLLWIDIQEAVQALNLAELEAIQFVTTFRGKPIAKGRKSLTLRLRFRAADRTLKHADVDQQMDTVVAMLQKRFDAEIRKASAS